MSSLGISSCFSARNLSRRNQLAILVCKEHPVWKLCIATSLGKYHEKISAIKNLENGLLIGWLIHSFIVQLLWLFSSWIGNGFTYSKDRMAVTVPDETPITGLQLLSPSSFSLIICHAVQSRSNGSVFYKNNYLILQQHCNASLHFYVMVNTFANITTS